MFFAITHYRVYLCIYPKRCSFWSFLSFNTFLIIVLIFELCFKSFAKIPTNVSFLRHQNSQPSGFYFAQTLSLWFMGFTNACSVASKLSKVLHILKCCRWFLKRLKLAKRNVKWEPRNLQIYLLFHGIKYKSEFYKCHKSLKSVVIN